MVKINDLTAVDEITAGDLFPIWSTDNGDARRASASAVKGYMQGSARGLVTAYASPSATGFTVTLTGTDDVWLVLTPVAGYAVGTIVLPSSPVDQQAVTVSCSRFVTDLTVSGVAIAGEPTTMAANGFFTMRYEAVTQIWRRVA